MENQRANRMNSIRKIWQFTSEDGFYDCGEPELEARLDHLSTVWQQFVQFHDELMAGQQEQAINERYVTEFSAIEDAYLEAQAALKYRSSQLKKYDADARIVFHQNENNDELINEPEHDNPVNIGEINEQQNGRYVRIHSPMPAAMNTPVQVPNVVVQLPHQTQVENTWGFFDGELANWMGFHDRFKSAVHENNQISNAFKFQYLRKSLKGKAAMSLGEWQLTSDNYLGAWERLKQLYARPYQTSKELFWKFNNLPKLEQSSGDKIQTISNVTHEVLRQLKSLNHPVEHYDAMFVHAIHDRLDLDTSKAWELCRLSENPSINEMLNFLDRQAKALAGVQFVQQQGKSDKKRFTQQVREHPSKLKISNGKKEQKQEPHTSKMVCVVCKEAHWLHRCPIFTKKMDVAARKRVVRENSLCHNCLRSSHFSKDCLSKPCGRCNVKHNSLLCLENPLNKMVTTVQMKPKSKKDNSVAAKKPDA